MLVLASKSPRRWEILTAAGIPFVARVSGVAEERREGEGAREYVLRLSREKAMAVERGPGEMVLGADTVVVVDETVLEKPADAEDAGRMLRMLAGRTHSVMTGICLVRDGGTVSDVSCTEVTFAEMSEQEIEEYVATGEPMDKAGGYAIQGLASKFIERVEGCYFNVVGLPISLVYRHLRDGQESLPAAQGRDGLRRSRVSERQGDGGPA